VWNTGGLAAGFVLPGAAVTAITLATQTAAGAHSDGGFVHVSNGLYRLDLPDAATAAGASNTYCSVILTHSGTLFETIDIALTAYDPNATGADSGTIADAVWDEARAGHVAAGTFGEYVLADTIKLSGDSTAADNLETMLDGSGGQTLSATLGTGAITSATFAAGAIDAAAIANNAIDASAIADGAIDAATFAAGAINAAAIAADAIDADAMAADAHAEIAAAVWNIADAEEAALPAANAAFRDKLNFLFALARNKVTINKTTGVVTLRNDADAAPIAARTDTDDGTTYTKTEWT
jgi:hypothetical protein